MNGNFKPTVTLADLYESQNQFLDAYVIYKYIYSMQPETHIKEKLDSIEKKIFEEYNKEYNPTIKKIFSKDEIEKFKIFPAQHFSQYQEIEASFIEETNFNKTQTNNKNSDKNKKTEELLKLFQQIKEMDISEIKKIFETHLEKTGSYENIKLSQIEEAIKSYEDANSQENQ